MGRQNRGPAAAQANREALMGSARRLLAVEGLDVPFSAIARDAGVSQGVLYRHFPSPTDLALAVFEENMARIEQSLRRAASDAEALDAVWTELVTLTVTDVAFVETAIRSTDDPRFRVLAHQVRALIDPLLERHPLLIEGERGADTETLLFGLRAIYGLVATREHGDPSVWVDIDHLLRRLGLPPVPSRPQT